jgi:hypothetical protein
MFEGIEHRSCYILSLELNLVRPSNDIITFDDQTTSSHGTTDTVQTVFQCESVMSSLRLAISFHRIRSQLIAFTPSPWQLKQPSPDITPHHRSSS